METKVWRPADERMWKRKRKDRRRSGRNSERYTDHVLRLDWQHGQGFQSMVALHLHLLIKCQNNMIFNYQQLSLPQPPSALANRRAAVSWS